MKNHQTRLLFVADLESKFCSEVNHLAIGRFNREAFAGLFTHANPDPSRIEAATLWSNHPKISRTFDHNGANFIEP